MLTTFLDWWVAGWVALEEWKLRLTSAKVEVEVEAELGKMNAESETFYYNYNSIHVSPSFNQ